MSKGKYLPGMANSPEAHTEITHLYEVGQSVLKFGNPMCARGLNKDKQVIVIGVSDKGICKICHRRALKGLKGVSPK